MYQGSIKDLFHLMAGDGLPDSHALLFVVVVVVVVVVGVGVVVVCKDLIFSRCRRNRVCYSKMGASSELPRVD